MAMAVSGSNSPGSSAQTVLLLRATMFKQQVHLAVLSQRVAEWDGSPITAGHNVFRTNVLHSYVSKPTKISAKHLNLSPKSAPNTRYCNCCFQIGQMCVVRDVTHAMYSGYSIVVRY